MVVRPGDRGLGVIGLMDTPRATACDALKRLHDIGIGPHDHDLQRPPEGCRRDREGFRARRAWSNLLPEDKVNSIKKLRSEGKVAMVGNGVNDVPGDGERHRWHCHGRGRFRRCPGDDGRCRADDRRLVAPAVCSRSQPPDPFDHPSNVCRRPCACDDPRTRHSAAVAVHEVSTLLVVFNAMRLLTCRDTYRAAPSDMNGAKSPPDLKRS